MHFIVRDAIKKYDALKFIINPVNKVLSYLVQCTNTTKKVLDKDIISAYWVAKKWLQIVYPQFYNKNEDILWKEYLKMNNIKMSIEVFSE